MSVSPETDISSINFSGTFELRSKKHTKNAKMESYSSGNSFLIVKFDISSSINDALRLVGYEVYTEEFTRNVSIPEIEGFAVFDISGDSWGVVSGIDITGPNRLIEVFDGAEYIMIPFDESIVIEIDKTGKKVVLDPPEGLRELNRE